MEALSSFAGPGRSVASSEMSLKPTVNVTIGAGSKAQSFVIKLNSQTSPFDINDRCPEKSTALDYLEKTGYRMESELMRKLALDSGEGFWDTTIGLRKIIYYEPGAYVQPHIHDIEERFTIQSGSCAAWFSEDPLSYWKYEIISEDNFIVPANTWHCLIAGAEGLLLYVERGPKYQKTHWFDHEHSQVWRKGLDFQTTVQELHEATKTGLSTLS